MVRLNLGCGRRQLGGWLNVDSNASVNPDKVIDLSVLPWPWLDSSVDEVRAEHFLEHLDNPILMVSEVWRVLKQSGRFTVIVPYWSSAGAHYDLGHKSFWAWRSFEPFTKQIYRYNNNAVFIIERRELRFAKSLFLVSWFANAFPLLYEEFLAGVFPAREIEYVLVKQGG